MCGIAGIFSKKGNHPQLINWLSEMSFLIRHRGPDGEGFLGWNQEKKVVLTYKNEQPNQKSSINPQELAGAFAHRRLSIIDLSEAGHQPFTDSEKQFYLTFNGEIYNYIELREDLKALGYTFTTQTDTEVLLVAYKAWGKSCLERLNGMFAFALLNLHTQEVWMARDRIGVKPFYYFEDGNHFAFASELKAFSALPFLKKELNHEAAFDYFLLNSVEQNEQTLFKNVKELLPGHSICYSLVENKSIFEQWFHAPKAALWEAFNQNKFDEIVENCRKLLFDSVRLRLRSDVAVGSCLSGGVDSSSIVCMADELKKSSKDDSPLHVFTSCFEDPRFDERKFSSLVVKQTGAQWHMATPNSAEFLQDIETMMYGQDLPTLSGSTYSQWRVMRMAQEQGIKVLLDGQGGDELFSGYALHQLYFMNDLLANGHYVDLIKDKALKKWLKFTLKSKIPAWLQSKLRLYSQHSEIYQPDFIAHHKDRMEAQLYQNLKGLNEKLNTEFYLGPLKHLLRCEDRSGMWHSIESRVPLADDINLANYIQQLSPSYKIVQNVNKAILRNAMRGVIPNEIADRKDKMGFSSPNNQWLREMSSGLMPYFENANSSIFQKEKLMNFATRIMNPSTDLENYNDYKFPAFMVWGKVFGG
jgi:asparagine synthase (glutamine-hydrolysing)